MERSFLRKRASAAGVLVDPVAVRRHVDVDRGASGACRVTVAGTAGGADQFPAALRTLDLRTTGVAVAGAGVAVRVARADLGLTFDAGTVGVRHDRGVEFLEHLGRIPAARFWAGLTPTHDPALGAVRARLGRDLDWLRLNLFVELDDGEVGGVVHLDVGDPGLFAAGGVIVAGDTYVQVARLLALDAVRRGDGPVGLDQRCATAVAAP